VRRFILLLAALACLLVPARASLQSDYLDIYIKMNDAAKMEATNDSRGALAGFEDCYSRLQRIHKDNPKWENALVLSRLADCKARIVALEKKLMVAKPKPAVSPAPGPVAAPAPESAKARIAELELAVKSAPNNSSAIFNLGTAYFQTGQTDSSIEMLQRGLVIEPNNVYAHNFLGLALLRKGRIDSAAKEFLKAIGIDEGFADAHYNLAILYATEDPPATKSAASQYKRAMELGIAPDPHLEKVLRMTGRERAVGTNLR
jgi:tetratricopeptide (TPR) repeat protein